MCVILRNCLSFFKKQNGIYVCIFRLLKHKKGLERMQFRLLMVLNLEEQVLEKELRRVEGVERVLGGLSCLFYMFP